MHSIKITTLLIQQTINEWIFQVVKSIYDNLQSEVRINNTTQVNESTSLCFPGFVLSPIISIITMEALEELDAFGTCCVHMILPVKCSW